VGTIRTLLVAVLTMLVVGTAVSAPAQASLVGKPCKKVGATTVDGSEMKKTSSKIKDTQEIDGVNVKGKSVGDDDIKKKEEDDKKKEDYKKHCPSVKIKR